jgi:hypothetical protein
MGVPYQCETRSKSCSAFRFDAKVAGRFAWSQFYRRSSNPPRQSDEASRGLSPSGAAEVGDSLRATLGVPWAVVPIAT